MTQAPLRGIGKRQQELGVPRIGKSYVLHFIVIAPISILRIAGASVAEIRAYRSGAHKVEWQKYRGSVRKNSQVALFDAYSVGCVVGGLVGCFPDRWQPDESGPCGHGRVSLIARRVQIARRRAPLRHVATNAEIITACTSPNIDPLRLGISSSVKQSDGVVMYADRTVVEFGLRRRPNIEGEPVRGTDSQAPNLYVNSRRCVASPDNSSDCMMRAAGAT